MSTYKMFSVFEKLIVEAASVWTTTTLPLLLSVLPLSLSTEGLFLFFVQPSSYLFHILLL